MVIDRNARNALAELLHQFVAGRVTNDEFVERQPDSKDQAVLEIESEAWFLYDDIRVHRLTGKWKLDRKTRGQVATWIMFLKTGLPYEWPVLSAWFQLLFLLPNLLTCGLLGRTQQRLFAKNGDIEVWPFIRRTDFETAKASPKYLSGAA